MNIELLNHWGEQFLNFAWPMLWQSSLLITVIFALDFALRRKIRAAIRYALWLVVLVKLILPPTLALPTGPSWWIHSPAPPPVASPPLSFTVSYGDQMTVPDFPTVPTPVAPPPKPPALKPAAWTMISFGVVSAGLLVWLLIRWRVVVRKVRNASEPKELNTLPDESARLAGLRSRVRLKLTEDSMSPAVCGLFRPVILLPRSLVEKLSVDQLRAVLLHEAIHLRRGDVWANCAQALLQIAYWWHPLLWLANARIRRVREEAVDDAVMLALRDDADIYAPTLLEVAKFAFRRPLASLGLVGILESRSALRQRIERLINFNSPRKAGLTIVSILGILAFSAVALPMGEAPEETNAAAISLLPNTNSPISTNAVNAKVESDKLVQEGKLLYEMGKFDEAEAKFNAALVLKPDNSSAFYYLSLVRQARIAREEHNGTNSVADSRVQVPKAWAPKVGIGLPVPNPYVINNEIHFSPGHEAILHKLNSLRLESISWSNSLPLSEVIRYLTEQSKLRDPDKIGINFIFNPEVATSPSATNTASEAVDPYNTNVKLVMKDASLHDVLDGVVLVADRPIRYTVEDYAVVMSPKPSHELLEMRTFKVDSRPFFSNLITAPGVQSNNIATMAESLFRKHGADLTAPGRSIAYNDKLGLLFVRATASEMDTVERIISALNHAPPQIHIKTRFIEVPESEVGAILQAGTAVDANETNTVEIITADKLKLLMRQLASTRGTIQLAQPEAVTSDGRQVQVRSDNATVDLVPRLLEDGYTLNLRAIVSAPQTQTAQVNIWDGQTLALVFPNSNGKNRLVVFVTSWIVDPAGNRLHSDDELRQMQEKAKSDIPPQQTLILSNPNYRVVQHALEQRASAESLAELEQVSTAGREAQRMRTDYVLQQPQYASVTNLASPASQNDTPPDTTNAIEASNLIQN
ncbi:MAG TPA: M56 family metallopeptidase, partial [Verrucomicrobiae bacterium]|nr:M56 family metallopeptidase [Verrucomicrobiae bacterium]